MSFATKVAGARAVMAFDNWPSLLFGRLFSRNTGLVVYRKKQLEILVDHNGGDENGTRACIVGDMYRKYIPHLKIQEPARVLDIGANGGGFPLMLLLENVRLGSVVSVEMNPATYSRLLVNLQSNIGLGAVAINAAVCGAGAPPEIMLDTSRGGTGFSMKNNVAVGSAASVHVKTTTFSRLYDQYFNNRTIDICKIDIEGAEYDLLDSVPDDVLRKIKYLFIEFHEDAKTPPVMRRFAELGFTDLTQSGSRREGAPTEVRFFKGPAS